jgi:uncharacterized protein
MQELLIVLPVIIIFSIVQGLFGVGLLVFGTPTCLLLGYSFESTLAYLLPSSIVISLVQTFQEWHQVHLKNTFLFYSIPSILIGIAVVVTKLVRFDFKILLGAVLLLSVGVRFSKHMGVVLGVIVQKHDKLYLMVMGLIHGMSNMGGALLTVFATTTYSNKMSVRSNIAYGYSVFGLSQLFMLSLLKPESFTVQSFIFPFLSLAIYLLVGQNIYRKTSERAYQSSLTIFMSLYGVVLFASKIWSN